MSSLNTTKSCVVPNCESNTTNSPEKWFFRVPNNTQFRKIWLKAIKRDQYIAKSNLYCCEDHFDIENDIENYIKYKLVGGKMRLKKGVIPHKFERQQQKSDKSKESAVSAAEKRKKKLLVKETVPPISNTNDDDVFIAYCKEECTMEDPLGLRNNYKCKNKSKSDKEVHLLVKNKMNELLHMMNTTSCSDETTTELETKPLKSERKVEKALFKLEDANDVYGEKQLACSDEYISCNEMPRNTDNLSIQAESSLRYSDEYISCNEMPRNSNNRSLKLKSSVPLNQPTCSREDEFDTFGRHVANQLRCMPLSEALKSQNYIQNYLSRRRLQLLQGKCSLTLNTTHEKGD